MISRAALFNGLFDGIWTDESFFLAYKQRLMPPIDNRMGVREVGGEVVNSDGFS
jgi:hypothetical protein